MRKHNDQHVQIEHVDFTEPAKTEYQDYNHVLNTLKCEGVINSKEVEFLKAIMTYGSTYEIIATRLDIPVGTVKSRLHKLRGVLSNHKNKFV